MLLTQRSSVFASSLPKGRVQHPRLAVAPAALQVRRLVCKASSSGQDGEHTAQRFVLPVAVATAAALIIGSATPDMAEAARSGGRMGGSSFRSSPSPSRSAPSPSRSSSPTVRNYNSYNYSAPPVTTYGSPFGFSPFGFSPFGFSPFGGYGYAPSFGFGIPLFSLGGFFQIIFAMFAISAVLNVIRSIGSRRKNDDFDDEDF